MTEEKLRPEDYTHSPAHYFVVVGDLLRLRRLLDSLPRLSHPSAILTESDSLLQSRLADIVSAVLDRRDVPRRETPLHLAVTLRPLSLATEAAADLAAAGADPSVSNASGWTPLHLALSLRRRALAALLLRHHRISAWSKLRRRLPSLLPALHRLPDFDLHISLRFESPLLPFLPRSAIPSEDLRLSKRASDLRADRLHRISFLFLSSPAAGLPYGSLLVLDRERKEIHNAFDGADDDEEAEAMAADSAACRPGIDVANARLVPCTNWRRRERTETVGVWKSRVYELQNVFFSFKTLAAAAGFVEEELPELQLHEDSDDGFLVAELPNLPARHSCYERGRYGIEEAEMGRRRSFDAAAPAPGKLGMGIEVGSFGVKGKEKEVVKNLKPMIWLTEDFPLKTVELLPMLDILANKIKVVMQLREILTTKLPPGTFPVKVAIPIVPTVRMIITFTKYISLQPSEQFFTPLSSPRHLACQQEEEGHNKAESTNHRNSWLKWNSNSAAKSSVFSRAKSVSPQADEHIDPFTIPSDYAFVSIRDRNRRLKPSKSRKGKQKQFG
ncbi:hypothetical protein AXF42_Ash018468 [Apostasia shenzhenica]|uniref:Ankyrin repeat domain-containing protein n=1 Tax=Apostasia shenzhenica TaxID=1088818 RepID=A0A2H9ZZC4_9ASPA|nr:hypothetical protein AXF42_Ash018468 [Apostasia shenzhenica]